MSSAIDDNTLVLAAVQYAGTRVCRILNVRLTHATLTDASDVMNAFIRCVTIWSATQAGQALMAASPMGISLATLFPPTQGHDNRPIDPGLLAILTEHNFTVLRAYDTDMFVLLNGPIVEAPNAD